MNAQKIAITIPTDLVVWIDNVSKRSGISRSGFIAEVLLEKISEQKKQELKEAYDSVFSDESICKEQLRTAAWLENCGNDEGQEW